MAILAIFIDGGYLDPQARRYNIRVDISKLVSEIRETVASKTREPLDLLRTYYYDCLPYQSNPSTEAEDRRFARKRSFFDRLRRFDRFEVREGRLALRGYDSNGEPIFQQKRTDLLLGLDFALLSGKNRITHAAVVAGDSDFLPASRRLNKRVCRFGSFTAREVHRNEAQLLPRNYGWPPMIDTK